MVLTIALCPYLLATRRGVNPSLSGLLYSTLAKPDLSSSLKLEKNLLFCLVYGLLSQSTANVMLRRQLT